MNGLTNTMNFDERTLKLLGNDFNPFNKSARERFSLEMVSFIERYKEFAHVVIQAKNEGYTPEELTSMINRSDLEFIESIAPEGTSKFDEDDFNSISDPEIIAKIGEDWNPFNWDAKTRVPLTVGMMVICLKNLCHVFIQADKEGLSMDDLMLSLDQQTLDIIAAA